MTTTEDLYQKAYAVVDDTLGWEACVRAVVDLALDAEYRPGYSSGDLGALAEQTADGEALAQLVRDVRDGDGHTVQIDGVLIAQCDEHGRVEARHTQARPDWEVLREAADLIHPKSHPTGMWLPAERVLRDEAKRLEAEHQAAQEAEAAEAEREKLIEQAAPLLYDGYITEPQAWPDDYHPGGVEVARSRAASLVDAGWRPAPESDGGEQA
ncbi:hypothetical protein ACK8HH_17205 [Gordonia sp. LUNF6]|uniref:hypothetical protein n=1 Tax=Gordonia sp. LUNF6 TaxID=3388658 RepID=UPI00399C3717